jgi:kynureninase
VINSRYKTLARQLDNEDALAVFRDRFNFPESLNGLDPVYLCGNSLGLQPKAAIDYVNEVQDAWQRYAVRGHFHGERPWTRYHRLATAGLAALTGAQDREVIAMNALTVNLHLLLSAFYRPTPRRHKILIESAAFPSDRFAVESQLRAHGNSAAEALIEWPLAAQSRRLELDDLENILKQHGNEIAIILVPGVQYYSGEVLPMRDICTLAHEHGCLVGLDLAHAIGNIPLQLHDWGADFAAWCSYKYLNAGPGAVAGAFVHSRHLDARLDGRLLGWWGNDESSRFQMGREFAAAPGMEAWQLSNPPILALAPLLASLNLFAEAGPDALFAKSRELTRFLATLLQSELPNDIRVLTPADACGSQLSLTVCNPAIDPKAFFTSLEALNVIVDWREPDVIRAAPAPLYNSYRDVAEFVSRLKQAVATATG